MMFEIKRIDHIQLAAPKGSENKARKFYNEILGFREIDKPQNLKKRGGAWFELGSYQLHIGIEEPFIPAKKAHPAFEVQGIDALKEHLIQNNVEVLDDHNLPNANRFYAFDCFGNRLEFLEWL